MCFYNHDDLRLYQSKYFYSYDDLRQILSLPSLSKVDFFCRSINLVLPLHPQTTHTCTTTLFTTFTCVHYIFRQKSFNSGNDSVNSTFTTMQKVVKNNLVGRIFIFCNLAPIFQCSIFDVSLRCLMGFFDLLIRILKEN